jgi:hypothetical protein
MAISEGIHVRMWDLQARPGLEKEFERIYGPDGDWVHLFRKSKAFLRTELYRNRLCAERNGYEPKRASYAQEGFSAPNPVRVGCKFCCNPLLGQPELLHTQSSMVSRDNSSQDKSACRRVTEIPRMPHEGQS